MKHSLTLTIRDFPHVHRWKPLCACGWVGVPRRRQREAVRQYREHVRRETRAVSRVQPRAVTAAADLPEGLRS